MKNYRVVVNGVEYEVAIEEMSASEAKAAPVAAPVAAPAAAPAAAPVAAPAAAPAGGAEVKAPMPGTILSVNVNVGDTVKAGQTLVVLEAMKMENEIVSPADGKVLSVAAQKGSAVDSGATLVVIG